MKITSLPTGGLLVDSDVLGRLKANKWTIGVMTFGLVLNLGLTQLGKRHLLTWHDINQVRTWKEMVFSLVVGQSGKAVRKWQDRQGEADPVDNGQA